MKEKIVDYIACDNNDDQINELIDNLTLFDDDLMSRVFDKNIPATELVLKIILGRDIKVISVKGQEEIKNPNVKGRTVKLDILALDEDGQKIDIEVQGNSAGAHVRRARYHSSVLDTQMLKKKEKFNNIKDSYVIFIYKNDKFGKGYPIYHVDRIVRETGEEFDDGSHIIYVNGKYKGNDDIGLLIKDFHCKKSSKIHYSELAEGVRYYKETEEGRDTMCEAVEKYGNNKKLEGKKEGLLEGKKEGLLEGKIEGKIEIVRNIMSSMKLSVDQALDAAGIVGKDRTVIAGKLK